MQLRNGSHENGTIVLKPMMASPVIFVVGVAFACVQLDIHLKRRVHHGDGVFTGIQKAYWALALARGLSFRAMNIEPRSGVGFVACSYLSCISMHFWLFRGQMLHLIVSMQHQRIEMAP